MNTQDRMTEAKLSHQDSQTGMILNRHLEGAAKNQGRTILSVKFKNRGSDWLVIIEQHRPDTGERVAFTQAATLGGAVRTLYSLLVQDRLNWKEPKRWAQPSGGE